MRHRPNASHSLINAWNAVGSDSDAVHHWRSHQPSRVRARHEVCSASSHWAAPGEKPTAASPQGFGASSPNRLEARNPGKGELSTRGFRLHPNRLKTLAARGQGNLFATRANGVHAVPVLYAPLPELAVRCETELTRVDQTNARGLMLYERFIGRTK